jgi:hypothetical protein
MECDICCEVYYTQSEHVKCRRIQCNISHELRELSNETEISIEILITNKCTYLLHI